MSEKDVVDRIKATLVPPFNDEFLELVKPSPDFYGPFWIMATMVFLLALVGNFANYVLSKFSNGEQWEGYFFKLELVRYAVVMVYSFGVGVPVVLFFMFKFMKCNSLAFPEVGLLGFRLRVFTGTRYPATCRPSWVVLSRWDGCSGYSCCTPSGTRPFSWD